MRCVEGIDRNGTVDAQRLDVPPGLIDGLRIKVQAVDEVTVAGAEGGGESSVAAAEMNDQTAGHPGGHVNADVMGAFW